MSARNSLAAKAARRQLRSRPPLARSICAQCMGRSGEFVITRSGTILDGYCVTCARALEAVSWAYVTGLCKIALGWRLPNARQAR